jgi:lysyl-tRNA synthetase, class II
MTDNITYDLIGQRQQRIIKSQKLKELGIDPYPSKSFRDSLSSEIIESYEQFESKEVTVAGRLMSWRPHGHLVFGHIQDKMGKIQLYIRDDYLHTTDSTKQTIGFDDLNLLDLGDIVEATGIVTKTKIGEVSVQVNSLKILTKAIRPLPEKWKGLQDKEKIFRQRYLDTIMNPENRWRFEKTAQIVFAIREFLNNRGFLEIKTPILQPLYGGGTAKPFTTKVNALDVNYYMAISHELYLKRLITAGFENVYNITGYFRNEGIDRTHNPEFQMLETMTAFKNYEYNMDLIEEMYKYISTKVFAKTEFDIRGQNVDFGKPWERIMMIDAVKKYGGIDFYNINSIEEAHQILDQLNIKEKPKSIGESMVLVFEDKVEDKLIQPTFVYGHPVEISPLAKRMSNNPNYVERFEIFIGGIEGGDNWTELNDPVELYERFKDQVQKGRGGAEEFHPMDIEFLEAMEYGMPPTTGLGPGIERLAMMMTGTEYIDDVLFFPMMRPAAYTDTQKKIYGEEYLETVESTESSHEDTNNVNNIEQQAVTSSSIISREQALDMLHEHVKDDYQLLHSKMVAKAMESLATEYNENIDLWYITGLLHDIDYYEYPDQHPSISINWFKKLNLSDELINAVNSHAFNRTGIHPKSKLDFALIACDELSGLIYAYKLMRPNGLEGMEAKSVKKKFKDKSFAAKVNRDEIMVGIEGLGVDLGEHIQKLIVAFRDMEELV